MARKKVKRKKEKYIKMLDKASVVVGVVAVALGMVRKIINYDNKSK